MAAGTLIWLARDEGDAQWAALAQWLRSHFDCTGCVASPAAIVVLQSRPGGVTRKQIEALHRRAPLAPLILICSPWCDGEQRGSHSLPGVIRLRWHQWQQRLPELLNELGSRPRQPRTATEIDRLQIELRSLAHEQSAGGSVAILSDRRFIAEALADACRSMGVRVAPAASESTACDWLLVDGWSQVTERSDAESEPHRVLLLEFPRPDDIERASAAGFAAVLALPLALPDLAAALRGPAMPVRETPARVA